MKCSRFAIFLYVISYMCKNGRSEQGGGQLGSTTDHCDVDYRRRPFHGKATTRGARPYNSSLKFAQCRTALELGGHNEFS